jgi:ribonuclease-3
LKPDYLPLYQALGYRFKCEELLTFALTHRSAGSPNNERMEFLGDSLLNYVVAEALFERFPIASEGELTRSRATLVKGDTLAEIAQRLDLGQYLLLGGGELKSGGWRRASILADALEAIIGAIYLDTGMLTCKQVVLQLLRERLESMSPQKVVKDPKTRLQEYLQAKQQALPQYRVLAVLGAPHAQHFEVECVISELPMPTRGKGESRRRAEQEAAAQALFLLRANPLESRSDI